MADFSQLPAHFRFYSVLSNIVEKEEARLHSKGITHLMFIQDKNILISLGKDGFLKAYMFPSLEKVIIVKYLQWLFYEFLFFRSEIWILEA